MHGQGHSAFETIPSTAFKLILAYEYRLVIGTEELVNASQLRAVPLKMLRKLCCDLNDYGKKDNHEANVNLRAAGLTGILTGNRTNKPDLCKALRAIAGLKDDVNTAGVDDSFGR